MTEEQVKQIKTLREQGFGYIRIGAALGVSSNTISAYCRRHGIKAGEVLRGKAEKISGQYCQCCGAPVEQKPHRKEKKFCSDKCRMKWWSAHKNMVKRHRHRLICQNCGREFESYADAKFCSRACYFERRWSL